MPFVQKLKVRFRMPIKQVGIYKDIRVHLFSSKAEENDLNPELGTEAMCGCDKGKKEQYWFQACGLKQYLASSTWCYCLYLNWVCCVLLSSHQSQLLRLHRQPQSSLIILHGSLLNILCPITCKVPLFKIFLLPIELFCSTPLAGLCESVNSSMRYLPQAEFAGNLLWNCFLWMKLFARMSRLQCSFWDEVFSGTRWMSIRDMKGNSRPWEHGVFNMVLPHHRWILNC